MRTEKTLARLLNRNRFSRIIRISFLAAMALVSLCIGTGRCSQGRALVENPINTKASDFVLFIDLNASSES